MRRIGMWLVTLSLLALPALSQGPSTPACSAELLASSPFKGSGKPMTYQPLAAKQRLFYSLTGLKQGSSLEVRYLVKGKPHLTEIIDLANAQLPQDLLPKGRSDTAPRKSVTAPDFETFLRQEQIFELLPLRPDLVRQLHQLSKDRTPIQVEIRQEGRLVESLPFRELVKRSAEMAKRPAVQLAVHSSVSGPGDPGVERRPAFKEYLPNCNDCTTEHPCETECGYDPGKGGPVTCGEYGAPCSGGSQCVASAVISNEWTGWYYQGSFLTNLYACFANYFGGSSVHQFYAHEYRRDLVRTTFICPNAPSCDGCYYQEQVIAYQLGYTGCWVGTGQFCFDGGVPCCSELCFPNGLTYCDSSC
jgi:hypothetical protein